MENLLVGGMLIIVNFIGAIIGFLFYYEQLAHTPLYLWLFVPDCPLFVLLTIPFYLGVVKNRFLKDIVGIGLLKYGVWTVVVLLVYSQYFLNSITGYFLLGEHIFMIIQSILFMDKISRKEWFLALMFFLANEFSDYVFMTHPYNPTTDNGFYATFAVVMSIASTTTFYLFGERIAKNKTVKMIKNYVFLT